MIRKRWAALVALFGVMVSTLVAAPGAALASEQGRKNTAMALGAAAVYSLLNKKTTQGLILGAGGLYAYKRYKDKKSDDRARRAARWGYRSGYHTARYYRYR
jgi:uncharacterized membrane protein YebE (DUF533 family)